MTIALIANIGSYPRIGDQKDHQRHRRGVMNFQNKEISAHAFRDVEQSVIQEVIGEQLAAGLDEVTDGLVSWHDPISHFSRKISGFKITGLHRFFDTNFYYRDPVLSGMPKKKEPFILPEFQFAKQNSPKTVRAILTGPLTLACHTHSDLKSFEKIEKRVALFTEMLADEIKRLESAGCVSIQIDEPSILQFPQHMKLLANALKKFSAVKKTAKLTLAVYFGATAPLFSALTQLPIDALQMDFTYDGKRLWDELMKSRSSLTMGLGLINARNTRMEPIDPLLHQIRAWIEARQPSEFFITPSAGLEYLPRDVAFNKIKLITKLREEALLLHAQ